MCSGTGTLDMIVAQDTLVTQGGGGVGVGAGARGGG